MIAKHMCDNWSNQVSSSEEQEGTVGSENGSKEELKT